MLSAAAALDVRVAQRRWRSSAIPTLICFWKYFTVHLYDPEVNPKFCIDEPRWALESHDRMLLVEWHVSVSSHPSLVLGPLGRLFNGYWTKNDPNGNLVVHLHLVPTSIIAAFLTHVFKSLDASDEVVNRGAFISCYYRIWSEMGFFYQELWGNPRFFVLNLNLFNTKHKPGMTYFQKDRPSYGIAVTVYSIRRPRAFIRIDACGNGCSVISLLFVSFVTNMALQ